MSVKNVHPIVGYGHAALRKDNEEIDQDYNGLEKLIDEMFFTMDQASGVGLAAPQIDVNIRLFVIDTKPMFEKKDAHKGLRMAFINPIILEESGKEWPFEEGCLSIPGIKEDVKRKETLVIEYYDEAFNLKTETFDDMNARVIQHEYDHIEGILFTDHLSAFKRKLLKGKLKDISKGKVKVNYKMKFKTA